MNYITQKGILRYFRDNPDEENLDVYISFVGNFTINGRKSLSTGFSVIEPKKIRFVNTTNELLGGLYLDNIDDEEDSDSGYRMFTANRNNNPLYPLNGGIVNHFLHSTKILDYEFEGNLIDKIKFFETKEEAELNFVALLTHYLESNNLTQAISTYNNIIDRLEITNPSELLRNI